MQSDEMVIEDIFEAAGGLNRAVGRALPGIKRFAAKALPVAGKIAGGVIGGPVGARLGGAAGKAGAAALSGQRMRIPQANRPPGLAPVVSQGSPAAIQLVVVLAQPDVWRALLALATGQASSGATSVGGVPVPATAVANLVGTLANQAIVDQGTGDDPTAEPEYLLGEDGEAAYDIGNPVERAAALLQRLAENGGFDEEWDEETGESDSEYQPHYSPIDAEYDALEMEAIGWRGGR